MKPLHGHWVAHRVRWRFCCAPCLGLAAARRKPRPNRSSMAGMMGNKALLVVNGGAPKTVAPGETHQGVKVVSTTGDQAVVELSGKRTRCGWAKRP
jgi:aspartyl protease family protein